MQTARRFFFIALGTLFEGVSLLGYALDSGGRVAADWAHRRAERDQ